MANGADGAACLAAMARDGTNTAIETVIGTHGVAPGGDGTSVPLDPANLGSGAGGGGGASSTTGNAGNGGDGAHGGGGGGGGACAAAFTSGAGGAGGDGICIVISWL